jgi:hypothetical protein
MLIAVGVGSYSFSKKYIGRTPEPVQALSTSAGENRPGQSWTDPAAIKLPSGKAAVPCGANSNSITALTGLVAGKEAVFVLLSGDDEEMSTDVSGQINAVVKMLSDQGRRVGTFTFKKRAQEYDQLIKQFSVTSLPCVIVVGQGCGGTSVSGEITELKLLKAFVRASMMPSSCQTRATGSSCCPK